MSAGVEEDQCEGYPVDLARPAGKTRDLEREIEANIDAKNHAEDCRHF